MAQTRPHCFQALRDAATRRPRIGPQENETSCTYGVIDEIRRQMFPKNGEVPAQTPKQQEDGGHDPTSDMTRNAVKMFVCRTILTGIA